MRTGFSVRGKNFTFKRSEENEYVIDHYYLNHLLSQIRLDANAPELTVKQLQSVLLTLEHDLWKRPEYLEIDNYLTPTQKAEE